MVQLDLNFVHIRRQRQIHQVVHLIEETDRGRCRTVHIFRVPSTLDHARLNHLGLLKLGRDPDVVLGQIDFFLGRLARGL